MLVQANCLKSGFVEREYKLEKNRKGELPVKSASDKVKTLNSTRKGDHGKTKLISGESVSKTNPRIEVGGNLDESNAALGLAKALTQNEAIRTIISTIQKHLVILGAEVSSAEPGQTTKRIEAGHIAELEKWIDDLQKESPLPRRFIDPGANPASAALDLARSIIRRTERSMFVLHETGYPLRQEPLSYVNRLACLAFTLARYAEQPKDTESRC
jgi:cob(I)alamin adenosyltransferase